MDSAPISAETRDGQSVPSRGVQLPNRFAGCQTLGEMLRRMELDSMERTRATFPQELHKLVWPRLLRYCEEWPDWVLRVAAEVFHVQFPTIPKETILDALRCVNFFVFVARIDGGPKLPPPKFPDLTPRIAGAMVGHGMAMVLDLQRLIATAQGIVPADRLAEFSKQASLEGFQCKLAPVVADYFKMKPSAFLEFQAGLGEAERNTFDKHGSLKETPLTPIYRKILSDWPQVERLSGPKALTEYLSPLLGTQHFEDKYARMKMICSRFQIRFLPSVK